MFNLILGMVLVLNGVVCYLLVKVNANQDRLILQLEKRLARLEVASARTINRKGSALHVQTTGGEERNDE